MSVPPGGVSGSAAAVTTSSVPKGTDVVSPRTGGGLRARERYFCADLTHLCTSSCWASESPELGSQHKKRKQIRDTDRLGVVLDHLEEHERRLDGVLRRPPKKKNFFFNQSFPEGNSFEGTRDARLK